MVRKEEDRIQNPEAKFVSHESYFAKKPVFRSQNPVFRILSENNVIRITRVG
jgi:hypothetical protein